MFSTRIPPAPWDCPEPPELRALRAQHPRTLHVYGVRLWRTQPEDFPDPGEWRGLVCFGRDAESAERLTGLEGFRNAHGVRVLLLGGTDRDRLLVALEARHRAWLCVGNLDCTGWARCGWPELAHADRLDPRRFPTFAEACIAEERDPWRGGVEAAPGRRLRLRGNGGALPAEPEPSTAPLRMAGAALRPSSAEPAAVTARRASAHGNLVALRQRHGRAVTYTLFGSDAEIVGDVIGRAPCGDAVVLTYTEFEALPRLLRRAGVRGVGVSTVDGCRAAAGG